VAGLAGGGLVHAASWRCGTVAKAPHHVAFFDFFGKPQPPPESPEPGGNAAAGLASVGQRSALAQLRRTPEVQRRWVLHCQAANRTSDASARELPAVFVHEFLVDPDNYDSKFLKAFLELAKLDPVRVPSDVDDDDEELGGFMDSNRFGLIKSEKWLRAEKELLVGSVNRFRAAGPENTSTWERYCKRLERQVDPEDEESQAVRNEMAMRSELGPRKSTLDAWYDAQTMAAPPRSEKWGI